MKRLLIGVAALALAIPAVAWAAEYDDGAGFTIQPQDRYQTPARDGGAYDPWDSYRDLIIMTPNADWAAHQCDGISDTLNPPEPGSGSPVISVVVDDDPAQRGDYTRSGCELWIHPDRIHQRLGPGSIGVRVDWPLNRSMAFTIRGKVDGRDPAEEDGGADSYVSPDFDESTAVNSEGAPLTAEELAESCDDWTWGDVTYWAYWIPVMEVEAGDWAPVDGQWVKVDTPHTVYTCSFGSGSV